MIGSTKNKNHFKYGQSDGLGDVLVGKLVAMSEKLLKKLVTTWSSTQVGLAFFIYSKLYGARKHQRTEGN